MGKVLNFLLPKPKPQVRIFICGCGGEYFMLTARGEVVCCDCARVNNELLVSVRSGFKLPA
jgi:hypothetical protein